MNAAVGLDVGGSFIKAVRLDADGEVVRTLREATPTTIEGILDASVALAKETGDGLPLGVGLAGLVDHVAGRLRWAPHLPGSDVPVRDLLQERLSVPVVVDNDANLAALAEHRLGAGAGAEALVMLTLGTGIGMGMVFGGRIYRGGGSAGEVAHVTAAVDGPQCACGRRGCWETLVSGTRLELDAQTVLGSSATPEDLVAAARGGHAAARRRLEEAGRWLGWGIEALVLVLDPDSIVIGGGPAAAGDLLLEPARRRLEATEGAGHRAATPLVTGILGADAGAIGAALAAREETRS